MARLQHFIIGVLLFSVMIVGFFSFYQDEASYYGVTVDPNYTTSYNLINGSIANITGIATSLQDKSESGEGVTLGVTSLGVGKSALSALSLPFDAIKIIMTLVDDFSAKIGIPAWITNVAITIMIIIVSYMVLGAIFGRKI